jgi:hypothetical protein
MNDVQTHTQSVNQTRRKLLLGAAGLGAASFAPTALSSALSSRSESALSGELICNIADPVKTLVLRNHSTQAMHVDKVTHGAFMFDGSVVDCNAACLKKTIMIQPNQEVRVEFNISEQRSLSHKIDEYNRIQSRVTRLRDGTRVIPFSATIRDNVASIV